MLIFYLQKMSFSSSLIGNSLTSKWDKEEANLSGMRWCHGENAQQWLAAGVSLQAKSRIWGGRVYYLRFSSIEMTMLTALLVFLHAGAGSVMVANGAVWWQGAQQRVTRGERRQGALPHQLLQFTVPGVLERTVIPRVRTNLVEGDGAVV